MNCATCKYWEGNEKNKYGECMKIQHVTNWELIDEKLNDKAVLTDGGNWTEYSS